MPVEWPFADDLIRLGGVGEHKIEAHDGTRQQETARSILSDLATRPGVILADEVGMGKTYVALAVIASIVRATRGSGRPVVVMVPPALASKWPRDWEQFKAVCCVRPDALAWVRDAYVHTPTDFFKLLDDPRERRPHIVWMTTGCFGRGLSDPWVKLALVRLARTGTRMDEEAKRKLYKWATTLVRLKHKRGLTPEIVERLLKGDLSRWRRILVREDILSREDDDPIPQYLQQHHRDIDWSPLVDVLRGESIPGRRGAVSDERLQEARWDFNRACQQVYSDWLFRVRWRAPLLVLDEAHHAKNDNTKLASLFRSEETKRLVETGETSLSPALLWEKFDRLLFLTATPFQLGHHELIRVLRSFSAAKWSGLTAPAGTRESFWAAMEELESRLNVNRQAGLRLDRLWGMLAPDVVGRHSNDRDGADAAIAWWRGVQNGATDNPSDQVLLRAIDESRQTKTRAESDPNQPWCSLRPWVIRHNRVTYLRKADGSTVPRRTRCPGRAIARDDGYSAGEQVRLGIATGLPIGGEETLPFLLAARAQGELAHGSVKGRAFFAEGLCSSYEAFHHTRENRGDARDIDDDGIERAGHAPRAARDQSLVPVSWYEEQVERLIPSKSAPDEKRYLHPKIHPVVRRAVELWLSGEKVLIFCFYRETAKALRQHIGREVERATFELAKEKLGFDAGHDAKHLGEWFERVARRLSDEDSPFYRAIITMLREPLEAKEFQILAPRADELVQLLAAYIRSPSFIARYLPLDIPEVREALSEGAGRGQVVREGAAALNRALTERTDASDMSMTGRVQEFLRFAKELAERGQQLIALEEEGRSEPLTEYLKAIAVQTRGDEDEEAVGTDVATFRVQQPVRMVYGETKRETRERLMLAFNSPMFPEILISSAVLGEGVDLHRFCRYVIHHDLSWNPSTIEQRTGRLDRIRCKAEVTRRPIVVYVPFIGGSADEKMFRVVQDRERWFQIVMGQKFQLDEATSEALASRVPLPEELARELVFDLRRWHTTDGNEVSSVGPSHALEMGEVDGSPLFGDTQRY